MSDATPDVSPAPASAPKRPRLRRLLKWGAVAVVLLVALAAALPTLLSTSTARDAILAWLAENVNRRVEFAKLDVSWMHGIRLEGLKVGDSGGGREPFLEAPLIEIDAPMLPLLLKRLRVEKFVVHDAVVRLTARGAGASNADGLVKTKHVRRRRRPSEASPKDAAPEPEEDTVLPEIHVPVEVKNLTIVFRNREGREARRGGIDFAGRLDTRDGPTTFDLNVPSGAGAGIRVKGQATLFESDGTLLPAERRQVDASVVLTKIDAKTSGDVLALFLGDSPASGVLDGKVDARIVGQDAKCDVDLRLAHVGYGRAAADAGTRLGDDLTLTGRFERTGDKFKVSQCKARADGLVLDADLAGGLDSMDGRATLDVDFARISGALRAMGADFPGSVAGRLVGSVQMTPSPSKGVGDFTLTGFRIDGLVAGRPPVAVDSAGIGFVVAPGKDRFELTSFDVKLPDLVASAHGGRASDGTLDLTADAKGDLGGLLARVRDLGFLPQAFAVNGAIDAQVHVAGRPTSLVVEVPRFSLTEKDVKIEASGSRAADGALDVRASGAGDLGALFGRAAAAGAGPKGLGELHGRFAFEATAKGPMDALAVDVPKLHVDGDLHLDAHGALAADGAIDAEVADLSGNLNDVLLLLRRTAILDRDLSIPGRLVATAVVRGTRERPEIPRATLKCTDGPIEMDVEGSLASSGALAATADLSADLAAMADLAHRAGYASQTYPVSGRVTLRARAEGSRDKIAVPDFRIAVVDGLADVEIAGSYGANGAISATANASGELDKAVHFAAQSGWAKGDATTGCKYSIRAVAAGTRDAIQVPNAQLIVDGPIRLDVDGHMDSERRFSAAGKVSGALQPLLDLAAAWSGETAKRVDGTIGGSFAADGDPDKFDVRVPQLTVGARAVRIDADGSRTGDGTAHGHAKIAGPIPDLLAVVRAFGFATDVDAAGRVDADVTGSIAGAKADCALSVVAADLVISNPKIGGATFREPRLALSVPSAKYDLDAKTGEVSKAKIEFEGAAVEASATSAGDVVDVAGSILADARFAKNHADLLADASFNSLSGPFQFHGDVSKGRAGASSWTGGFALAGADVVAPNVHLASAKLTGKLADGVLTVDPIDATMNGGTVSGRASIGLVGDAPSHHLAVSVKNVEIDEDLAPLVAHASPLFAVGEEGKTGGKASADLDLSGKGLDSKAIRKSLSGSGTVGLVGAYVQSTNWIGELLQFLGAGDRLEIGSMTVPFKIHDSLVETTETPLSFAGISMLLGGHASLADGKLDYVLRAKAGRGGILSRFGSLLDKDGYIPLRLGGTLRKPKLKLPDLKDALRSGLGGLLGGNKDDDKDEPSKPDKGKEPKKKKGKPADEPPPVDQPPKKAPPKSDPPGPEDEPPPPPPPK